MHQLLFTALIIHAERERGIEEAMRVRRLLRPLGETTESTEARDRRSSESRALTPRTRPTGG